MSSATGTGMAQAPGRVVGRVAGVPVRVTGGGVLLAVWMVWLYHVVLVHRFPGGGWQWLAAAAIPALLAGSVLLHEIGHAVTGTRQGLRVRWIVLDALGGATEFERDAPAPAGAAAVAAAGPAVSVLLTVLFALLSRAVGGGVVGFVLGQAAVGNGVVAAFNLLPGLPLDGGHVLRAVVWRLTGRERASTVTAAVTGLVLAAAIVIIPLWLVLKAGAQPGLLGVGILVLVAFPVGAGALGALRSEPAGPRDAVAVVSAWQMSAPAVTMASGNSVQEGLRLLTARAAAALVVLNPDGRVAGLLDETDLGAVPVDERGLVSLGQVTAPVAAAQVIPGRLAGGQLWAHLRACRARILLLGDAPLSTPRVLLNPSLPVIALGSAGVEPTPIRLGDGVA